MTISKPPKNGRTVSQFIALLSLLWLSACTVPRAEITPEGYLEIFGPSAVITADNIGEDWIVEGAPLEEILKSRLSMSSYDGSPALNLTTGNIGFAVLRRVKANLLAAPFLNWSWKISAFSGDEHPVRLIIGFHGGDPKSGSWGSQPLAYIGTHIPPHDRIIAISWDANPLKRGSVSRAARIPRYIARGGPKKSDWSTENIDLAALYRKIWPGDEHANVQVMFAGFSARASTNQSAPPAWMQFADLILSR